MPEGLPYLDTKELTVVFNYKNVESCRRAISRGTFPVPTYKLGKQRVADREVVKEHFRKIRAGQIRVTKKGHREVSG